MDKRPTTIVGRLIWWLYDKAMGIPSWLLNHHLINHGTCIRIGYDIEIAYCRSLQVLWDLTKRPA